MTTEPNEGGAGARFTARLTAQDAEKVFYSLEVEEIAGRKSGAASVTIASGEVELRGEPLTPWVAQMVSAALRTEWRAMQRGNKHWPRRMTRWRAAAKEGA